MGDDSFTDETSTSFDNLLVHIKVVVLSYYEFPTILTLLTKATYEAATVRSAIKSSRGTQRFTRTESVGRLGGVINFCGALTVRLSDKFICSWASMERIRSETLHLSTANSMIWLPVSFTSQSSAVPHYCRIIHRRPVPCQKFYSCYVLHFITYHSNNKTIINRISNFLEDFNWRFEEYTVCSQWSPGDAMVFHIKDDPVLFCVVFPWVNRVVCGWRGRSSWPLRKTISTIRSLLDLRFERKCGDSVNMWNVCLAELELFWRSYRSSGRNAVFGFQVL